MLLINVLTMNEKNYPRLLGLAVFVVFCTSFLSSILRSSIVGSIFDPYPIADVLTNISNNLMLFRISIIVEMFTSIFIVILAILFFIVLNKENKLLAYIAFGWWLVEPVILAISQVGFLALISLSDEFISAGSPQNTFYVTLGDFLFTGFYDKVYLIHNLFFGLGGIIWYYLLLKSKSVPVLLSGWGVIAISLFTVNIFRLMLDPNLLTDLNIIFSLPYFPFEPVLGLWLLIKGIPNYSTE